MALRQRRETVRLLDATDPGEALSDATLRQPQLDLGIYDLDALFAVGDDLFEHAFRPEAGLGNGLDGPPPSLVRVQIGERGGPDAFSCASCHSLGGLDGAGANTQNAFFRGDGDSTAADERNPPHLLGLGPIERLAQEMSRELSAIRDQAAEEAIARGVTVTRELSAQGVRFGVVRADPEGRVDTTGVEGVDRDLVIRPFGWKGHQPTIRAMVTEAFRLHMGMLTAAEQRLVTRGELDPEVYGDGGPFDIDDDGVGFELDDGMISTMVAYLTQLEVPIVEPPRDPVGLERFARGERLFGDLACASCHRPVMEIQDPVLEIRPDHPELADSPVITVDVARDGEFPKIEPRFVLNTSYLVPLFSDLRRHEMGSALATPANQGSVATTVFLTRPLWGLADTAPYLHDGRAPTLDAAILAHGGEARASRDAFAALDEPDRAALRVFLTSLTRSARAIVP